MCTKVRLIFLHSLLAFIVNLVELMARYVSTSLFLPQDPYDSWTRSAADKYISLANTLEQLDPAEVDHVYNELEPVDPNALEGEWNMHVIDTGHPAQALADDILPLLSTMDFNEDAEKVKQCCILPFNISN